MVDINLQDRLVQAIESHNNLIEQRDQIDAAIKISTGRVLQLQELIQELQEVSDSDEVIGNDVESQDS